jgi:hypothetical protein
VEDLREGMRLLKGLRICKDVGDRRDRVGERRGEPMSTSAGGEAMSWKALVNERLAGRVQFCIRV